MHLASLQMQGLITWYDYDISSGTEWEQNINRALNTAQIILLLFSPDFMHSDFCYSTRMQEAMEMHKRGEARVIPIIVRPTSWKGAPFEKLQTLPTNANPITLWANQDGAFANIVNGIQTVIKELSTDQQSIEFSIERGNITSFKADVLALKYAQMFHGTDKIVADLLNQVGTPIDKLRPDVDDYCYVPTQNCIQARYALFVGVPVLLHFNYQRIQEFAARVLHVLAFTAPATKHLAMTVHGAGFGLDEIEAFLAQFRGYLYGLQNKQYPTQLEKITIIDNNVERVRRLQQAFEANFASADFISKVADRWAYRIDKQQLNGNSKGTQRSGISPSVPTSPLTSPTSPLVLRLLPPQQRQPILDHHLLDQFQASLTQRSLGILAARFDDAAGDKQATRYHYARQFGSDQADNVRNNVCDNKIVLSSHARRLRIVEQAKHNFDALAHTIQGNISGRTFGGDTTIIYGIDALRTQ
jgi:hypothetical protein